MGIMNCLKSHHHPSKLYLQLHRWKASKKNRIWGLFIYADPSPGAMVCKQDFEPSNHSKSIWLTPDESECNVLSLSIDRHIRQHPRKQREFVLIELLYRSLTFQ